MTIKFVFNWWWITSLIFCLHLFAHTCCADGSSSLDSGALIGIIVACVCVVVIVLGAVAAWFVFRLGDRVFKHRQTQSVDDLSSGHVGGLSLPVDIPLQAVTREPPPQYTPRAIDSAPHGQDALSGHRDVSISVMPPPYYTSPVVLNTSIVFDSLYEAPPGYQSRINVSEPQTVGTTMNVEVRIEPGRETGRQFNRSMDSFMEYPSMSGVLLTSSRSSLPASGTVSRGAASHSGSSRGTTSRRIHNGVQGNSLDRRDTVNEAEHCARIMSNPDTIAERSVSLADINKMADIVVVPQDELARQTFQVTGSNKCRTNMTTKSLPSIYCADELHSLPEFTNHATTTTANENDVLNQNVPGDRSRIRVYKKYRDCAPHAVSGAAKQGPAVVPPGGGKQSKRRRAEVSRSLSQLETLNEETSQAYEIDSGERGETIMTVVGRTTEV